MRRSSIKKAVCTAVVMTMLFPVSGFVLADETINYSFSVDKTVFVIGSDFTPGLTDINGTKYYIDENGSLSCSCFITVEGKTYYFGDNGRAATGTVNIDGVTYQFDSRGVLL